MNSLRPNFIYLSQIIDLPVKDFGVGKKFGYVTDVVADLREMYPRINALIVKKRFSQGIVYLPWSAVKNITEEKTIEVEDFQSEARPSLNLSENEIRLKDTFWDKQIVDISGSKLERVNDLHILRDGLKLWLVHVDVGFKGLMRRLGWLKTFSYLVDWLFSYKLKDKLIPWKYVEPISTARDYAPLSLKVTHSRLSELHPADLADILIDLGTEERIVIFKSFDNETAAEILQELPLKICVQLAGSLETERLAGILTEMPFDEEVDLLAELPTEMVGALFRLLPVEEVDQIKDLLKHSENIAGGLMNTEFISVSDSARVGEVLAKIKSVADDIESIYYVYIIDESEALIGVVTLKQLLISEPKEPVAELMRKKVIRVEVDTHVKKVAQVFYKYNFVVVPVVDGQERILGIITIKDALEAVFPEIREETEENE